jgi:acetylornithine deacetylase/succinyl-diaminopimelate desuccinylase-like protein
MSSAALEAVFNYIDARAEESIADLQRLMQAPSITEDEAACRACAEMLAGMMRDIGLQAEVLPSAHNPVVVAESPPVAGRPTLLITSHYDVVAPGSEAEWASPPFAAVCRDGDIVGRGAADPKGNLMAGLKAAQAWLQAAGELPVNLKFLVEGDDEAETGRHLGDFVDAHRERLQADGVLLLDAGYTRDGNSPVHLGSAGSLAVMLRARTGSKEPYFIWTQLVPDAAFRLSWALASLKDQDERVRLPGFYDAVQPPTPDEIALLEAYPWRDEEELEFWGIESFVTGARGVQAIQRLLYTPTCSIHGFEPGLDRPNANSLVPCEARAMVNFHLVPDQDPDQVLAQLRQHLQQHGFGDVAIEVLRSFKPIAGSARSPLGQALLRGAEHAGVRTYLLPHSFEFGDKWCWLGQRLGVEGALIGVADPDRCAHYPNEHISIPYYLSGIKWVAAALGEYQPAGRA